MLFCKMNGLGNDYIFVDSELAQLEDVNYLKNSKEIIKKLSNRHFGIGGDGLVILEPSINADAMMHIYNADGTEAEMCGNALRCVGKILYDKYHRQRNEFTVNTLSGERQLKILKAESCSATICSDMGKPNIINRLDDLEFINVGNPHLVFYCDSFSRYTMHRARELSLEYNTNVEAVVVENDCLIMRVYERGVGETLACGTGATAVAYSAFHKGLVGPMIKIKLLGGILTAQIDDGGVSLIGEATLNFIGEIDLKNYGKN